ncbi:CheR family methyltransferase [Breznakiella homolactica]|uniref:Chemotaxis protein CheW n=1 Tax=Breznakiella homolactica TaxID=2798577 RepID=A0A7T8BBW5_9SPIR|nr:CheR family methyltransferase [Breznakiella homolactica]QQO10806.1 chemotaxis protein CheW [Breznakiella homolactica]
MEMNDLKAVNAAINAEIQEQKERVDTIDFKMVTFSLGGKDYGVDIMNVKEIAKADKFTYVPNAASFVRGVYNLRGDIIPIVDLRTFFHLPIEKKSADGSENMLILRIGDKVFGTIVDQIDKVVGINSETIQPPHPIFGDINIKYISGVVEKQGQLFIILDVIRIFTYQEEEKTRTAAIPDSGSDTYYAPPAAESATEEPKKAALSDSALDFIKESLSALKHFSATIINDDWIRRRFVDWTTTRPEGEVQLKNQADADEFLSSFYSPDTGRFWDDDYAQIVKNILPNMSSSVIQVWNPGCGKGYETFSFACILKTRYPDAQIKIWANDNDIMAISSAPNMVFDLDEVPEYCRSFMVRGSSGYSFNQSVKDSIMFEYHDVLHANPFPDLDIILSRDLLSFMTAQDQEKIMADFGEKIKNSGVIILGRNEEMPGREWRRIANDPVSAYMRNE